MSAGDTEIRDALFMADEIANCRRKREEEAVLEKRSYGFRITKRKEKDCYTYQQVKVSNTDTIP